MKNLKILFHKTRDEKPEKIITIPLTMLHLAGLLFPEGAKSALEREGIDLMQCKELAKEKGFAGTLIEIESPTGKMTIAVE